MIQEFTPINGDQVKAVIRHVVIEQNEPAFFYGRAGVGKSSIIAQACEDNDAILVDIRLSQYDSVDLRGFPGVSRHAATLGQTVWHAPSTMPFVGNDQFPDDKKIVVFFDEMSSGQVSTLAVAYQLMNDRRCGEHLFKPNVFLCAAGNLDDDKGVVNRMPMPLLNRMTQYLLNLDIDVFCAHAQAVGVPPIFIAFWNFRKELVATYDPAKPTKVIATPRSWFKAVKYYQSTMPDDIKWASINGAVGQGPGLEFQAFVEVWQNVIPIKDIIANPKGVPLPKEASMQYATTVNVSGNLTRKNAAPLYEFLKRMPPEFTVLGWTLAGKRDKSLFATPEFIDFGQRYRDAFSAF